MPESKFLYCSHIRDEFQITKSCCTSCHEDEWEGYWMCEGELKDGREYSICCYLYGVLYDSGLA